MDYPVNRDLAGVKAGFRSGPAGTWTLPYRGVQIQSAYQPVYELATGSVVGHKAVLRCDDPNLDPESLFVAADYYLETLDLSDAVRILHLCNYASLVQGGGDRRIFVPARAETLSNPAKGGVLEACIASLGLAARRVVLELDVGVFERLGQQTLAAMLAPFQALGCAVLGKGYDGRFPSPETILAGRPDFVAIDPDGMPPGSSSAAGEGELRRLTTRLRRGGIKTVFAGIESARTAESACSAGVDLGYGFHLCPPETDTVRMETHPDLAQRSS